MDPDPHEPIHDIAHLGSVELLTPKFDRSLWYFRDVLGMEVVTFGAGRRALTFGISKINLHQAGQEFEPKAHRPTPGSADLCFISPLTLAQVIAHLKTCQVEILEGPVRRTGARGPLESVYFRDPDWNLIEVSNEVTE